MIFNIKEGRFIEKENVKKIQYEDYDVYYNVLIFENLTNLSEIKSNHFTFCALPLKFENADGAPIRAIAIID